MMHKSSVQFLVSAKLHCDPPKKILTGLFFDTEPLSSKWDENIVQENMVQEANAAATVTFSEGQTPVKELLTKFLREEKEQSDMVDNV
jgi:hypothetical protein